MADEVPRPAKRRISLSQAYKAVFSGPDGERVLYDLMTKGGMLESGSLDPQEVHFQNGRRSMALEILKQLSFDERRVLQMALTSPPVDDFTMQE